MAWVARGTPGRARTLSIIPAIFSGDYIRSAERRIGAAAGQPKLRAGGPRRRLRGDYGVSQTGRLIRRKPPKRRAIKQQQRLAHHYLS